MKIKQLGTERDGTRSVEVRVNEISYKALLRCIRKIPGAIITKASHDPMNDNANIFIRYKDINIIVDTPFSDYIINCNSPCESFDEFISFLENYSIKWWERFF